VEILRERGVEFDAIEYLKQPPGEAELRRILGLLGGDPAALVRTKDKKFAELGLDAADYRTVDEVVALLVEHPALMQRPIVVAGKRAVIARPPEAMLSGGR
jgi:arsenate reductase (glutaredoxin)